MKQDELLELVYKYLDEQPKKKFLPGESVVPVSGADISSEDIVSIIRVALSGWFTEHTWSRRFGNRLKDYVGTDYALLCNSGSSANLLALSAVSEHLFVKQYFPERNKIVTCATGFPTTIVPIIQNGFVPLFVDADPRTLNPNIDTVLEVLEREDVAGVILAHTLGFPYDAEKISVATLGKTQLFIEDCADALGAEINGKKVGTFGDASTYSFFPAHQITCAEGGAVLTNFDQIFESARGFRDWGRSCVCAPGQDNVCGKRFDQQFPALPAGWDHKYTFDKLGYNLKITDLQSALGFSQMGRIDEFVEKRIQNYSFLLGALYEFEDHLNFVGTNIFSKSSPFGFPVTVDTPHFTRRELVNYLETHKIRTRPVFAGNIVRHPMMDGIEYEVHESLIGSDQIMANTLWIGCHPSLTKPMLDYVVEIFNDFFKERGLR